jgi:hypothetical protein
MKFPKSTKRASKWKVPRALPFLGHIPVAYKTATHKWELTKSGANKSEFAKPPPGHSLSAEKLKRAQAKGAG